MGSVTFICLLKQNFICKKSEKKTNPEKMTLQKDGQTDQ